MVCRASGREPSLAAFPSSLRADEPRLKDPRTLPKGGPHFTPRRWSSFDPAPTGGVAPVLLSSPRCSPRWPSGKSYLDPRTVVVVRCDHALHTVRRYGDGDTSTGGLVFAGE